MSRFGDIGSRFRTIYRKENGERFLGDIVALTDSQNQVANVPFRQVLRVGSKCRIAPGDVFFTTGGATYLVSARQDEDGPGLYSRTFRIMPMERHVLWERTAKTKDPVTGLDRDGVPMDLGMVWVTFEPIRHQDDVLKVRDAVFRVTTNAELLVDDHVDNHVVLEVYRNVGITTAEVR